MGWSEVKWLWEKSWFVRGPAMALSLVAIIFPLLGLDDRSFLRWTHGLIRQWDHVTAWLFGWVEILPLGLRYDNDERSIAIAIILLLITNLPLNMDIFSKGEEKIGMKSANFFKLWSSIYTIISIGFLFYIGLNENFVEFGFITATIFIVVIYYLIIYSIFLRSSFARFALICIGFIITLQALYFAPVFNTYMCEGANAMLSETKDCSAQFTSQRPSSRNSNPPQGTPTAANTTLPKLTNHWYVVGRLRQPARILVNLHALQQVFRFR